jgi:prevent-host-death family protein
MPISEVKTRLPELVSGVAEREEEIVVTRNGKPAAVLVVRTLERYFRCLE